MRTFSLVCSHFSQQTSSRTGKRDGKPIAQTQAQAQAQACHPTVDVGTYRPRARQPKLSPAPWWEDHEGDGVTPLVRGWLRTQAPQRSSAYGNQRRPTLQIPAIRLLDEPGGLQ